MKPKAYGSERLQKARAGRALWRRIVTVLSCVVVFCTTYALILPAITMSDDVFCGKEEHTHTDECYELRLICDKDTGEQDGEETSEPTREPHTHTDDCWQTKEVLTCTVPEGHVHQATCYEYPLICGQEEGEEHTHTEECMGEPELICSLEENHTHSEECYTQERELICGKEEWTPDPTEPSVEPPTEEKHVHVATCYDWVLVCELEEHTHSLECYSDPEADLETPEVWRRSLPAGLTEDWSENVLDVARSQLGYAASTRNYLVDDENAIHGYTRYGAWSGEPYGAWNTRFVSFCLRYANVPSAVFPDSADCALWQTELMGRGLYAPYGAETPAPGDVLFLDMDGDGTPDRVGVFTGGGADESGESYLDAIEGDCDGVVNAARHYGRDHTVLGFGRLPKNPDMGKYTCGRLAHVHEGCCYDGGGNLQCGFEAHIHDENCRTGVHEHEHGDDALSMRITVEGPRADEVQVSVETVEEGGAVPLSFQESMEAVSAEGETADAGDMPDAEETSDNEGKSDAGETSDAVEKLLFRRKLTLLLEDKPVDLANYRITAEITVAPSVLEPLAKEAVKWMEEAAPEAELGVAVSALRENEDGTVTETASADFRPGDTEGPKLTVEVENGAIAVQAVKYPNPTYTVQYYANIPRFAAGGEKELKVFDTSGGKLPTNGGSNPMRSIYLNAADGTTSKNAGNSTQNYRVATVDELTEMYSNNRFEYVKAPNTAYINKLIDNDSYELAEVWVLKEGKDSSSTNRGDWTIYSSPSDVHFTSRENRAGGNIILVTDKTCVRLVYNCGNTSFTTPSTFYDYDISSGQNADGRWRTGITGINSESNYGTSSNGQRNWRSYCDVLAFGNANCGTGMANYKFADIYLNRHSGYNSGCTFGLAKSLSDGKIVYNDWLVTPNLFNDGTANGKHTYKNSSLTFSKIGDTYTLDSAAVSGVGSITGLQDFFHPSPNAATTHTHILTNDFWPLDAATNKTDPNIGGSTTRYFQGYVSADGINGSWTDQAGDFPGSDDGREHNCFFGMQYAVEFTLSADYVGPLEYYFFGDDDMWVFLDNKLVCDIGGVHSSVGEYVNLWDYLEKGTEGKHTLTFFYTERGASGSTCYMNFTLPSVTGVNIEQKTAQLRVEKKVQGEDDPNKEFNFQIQFFDKEGNPVKDDYAYARYAVDGSIDTGLVICDGETFSLRAGDYVLVSNLPYGLRYTITETVDAGYTVTNTVNGVLHDGAAASGTVIIDAANTVTFTNTRNTVGFQLQKLDPDGKSLSGAEFTLADSSGSLVNAVEQGDGNYKIPASATEQIVDQGVYYIAAAADQNFVLAQDTSAAAFDAKLQTKTGVASQKFRVYRQSDGSYSFQCLANGKWLDLDSGKLDNGTLVHFWDNATPNDNQKWFLVTNDDGSLTFKPRVAVLNKSNAVMDINAGNLEENQKIQIWEGNSTKAQKWVLVPVNSTAAPSTTQIFQVNAEGILHISGLLPGTYTLTETKAPSGCIGLDGPVTIHVDAAGNVTVTGSALVTAEGSVVRVTNKYPPRELTLEKKVQNSDTSEAFSFTVSYTVNGGSPVEQTISLANGEKETISIPYNAQVTIREGERKGFALSFRNGESILPTEQDGSCTFIMKGDVTIQAVNTAGYRLPETGGSGTAGFAAWGILLIAAACLAIHFRAIRRRDPPSF